MLQQIEEPCSLGVHAAVVIPPTWILRARRPQVSLPVPLTPPPPHVGSATYPGPPALSPTNLLPLQNTLKASKKKKRASFKRKSSKKGPEVRPGAWGQLEGNGREGPTSWSAEPSGLMQQPSHWRVGLGSGAVKRVGVRSKWPPRSQALREV